MCVEVEETETAQRAPYVRHDIASAMESVEGAMAIGRTFEESIQKAIHPVDPQYLGFQGASLSQV
jgi:carbamoylphosphate synthase large subunit